MQVDEQLIYRIVKLKIHSEELEHEVASKLPEIDAYTISRHIAESHIADMFAKEIGVRDVMVFIDRKLMDLRTMSKLNYPKREREAIRGGIAGYEYAMRLIDMGDI